MPNPYLRDMKAAFPAPAVLPDATVHLMPEVGHLPMMEDPTGTARDGLAFLDRIGA